MNRFGYKYKDVAVMLKISTVKMISILKDEGVILNTNGRNMPIPMYVQRGWFIIENISFMIEHANGQQTKVVTPTVIITNRGFYEIERLVINNIFTACYSRNLFKDIEIYVRDFFSSKKQRVVQNTINVENENYVEIYHSTEKKTELILKYQKEGDTVWLPK